jgi:hypothetical protein
VTPAFFQDVELLVALSSSENGNLLKKGSTLSGLNQKTRISIPVY